MPRIWDLHCHLVGTEGRTPEERMTTLLSYASRMGIERVCVYMGMQFLHHPGPDDLRQQNDEVIAALSHYHDRAFGFCYVSGEHVEASLREIDRCIENGPMVGIKLWVAKRAEDEALNAIVERTIKHKALVFQHTWVKTDGSQLAGESTPEGLAALARRFPEGNFVCGHTGGTWELGIRAVRDLPNVSVETAGFDPTAGMVEMAVRELGAERVLFGSDAGGRSYASQLSKVLGAEISDVDRALILSGNLRRLLAPIVRAKGMRFD
ncbi:amidohydrolase family protein [Schlesneria sp.]|uniref:amidohydrolase family protein n=1 Tax=Schlesneria sp. TaxID=2762018 RepID=UPI002EDBE8E5